MIAHSFIILVHSGQSFCSLIFFFFTVDLKKTFKFFKYFITLVYYEWPQGKVFGVFAELAPRPHVWHPFTCYQYFALSSHFNRLPQSWERFLSSFTVAKSHRLPTVSCHSITANHFLCGCSFIQSYRGCCSVVLHKANKLDSNFKKRGCQVILICLLKKVDEANRFESSPATSQQGSVPS